MDQLARGRRGENGNQEKTGGSDSTDQMYIPWCAQEGLLEHPKVSIISFLTPSLSYMLCICVSRGGVAWGRVHHPFPLLASFGLYLRGSWCSSSSEQGGFIPPSSFRLFVQFCLPEPACGDFLDMYIMMQHKGAVKSVGRVSES